MNEQTVAEKKGKTPATGPSGGSLWNVLPQPWLPVHRRLPVSVRSVALWQIPPVAVAPVRRKGINKRCLRKLADLLS